MQASATLLKAIVILLFTRRGAKGYIVYMPERQQRSKNKIWWAQVDSNHRPHAYQACALTTWAMSPHLSVLSPLKIGGDERDRTDDPLLAKQVLSQLSYTPMFWVKSEEWKVNSELFILTLFLALPIRLLRYINEPQKLNNDKGGPSKFKRRSAWP